MSRYQQRRRQRLQNPEIATGYWEMDSDIRLIEALDLIRQQLNISTEELARRTGRQRATISRLFHAEHVNPTLGTFSDLLRALHFTAEIRLRPAGDDDPPITVSVDAPEAIGA